MSSAIKIEIPLGILVLIGRVLIFNNTRAFVADSVSATGTIVDFDVRETTDKLTFHPVIEFTTAQGTPVTFTASNGKNIEKRTARNGPSLVDGNDTRRQIGDSVNIRYKPSTPVDAKIDSFLTLRLMPIILVAVGTMLAMGGAIAAKKSFMTRDDEPDFVGYS